MGKYFVKLIIVFTMITIIPVICQAQKIRFYSEPKSIEPGDSALLKWKVSDINPKKIKDLHITEGKKKTIIASGLEPKGEIVISPVQSTVYRFNGNFKLKKLSRSTKINVAYPNFAEYDIPENIAAGNPLTISWEAVNAEKVFLNIDSNYYDVNTIFSLFIDSTTTITLTAINKNGYSTSVSRTVNLKGVDELTGDTVICAGDILELSWKQYNAEYVKIKQLPDTTFNGFASVFLRPQITTNYNLEFHLKDSSIIYKNFHVRVLPRNTFNIFYPKEISAGEEITMQWEFANNKFIKIINFNSNFPGKGALREVPKESTTYIFEFFHNGEKLQVARTVKIREREYFAGYRPITNLSSSDKLSFEIIGSDRTGYPDSVKLKIAVFDIKGFFVTGIAKGNNTNDLSRKYFRNIIEEVEGRKYPVNSFTVREINHINEAFDVSFALDYSGSMSGDIKEVEKSIKLIIENKYGVDRFAFVKFDDKIVKVMPLTRSKDSILGIMSFKGLDTLGGSTALYAGAYDAMTELLASNKNRKLIIMTDGYENASLRYLGQKAATALDLISFARLNDISLNFVSYKGGTNETLLDFLAWITDGIHYNIQKSKQVADVFNEINRTSKYYYEITYKPLAGEGTHNVQLVYYNNQQETSTKRNYFIGNDYSKALIETENNSNISTSRSIDTVCSVTGKTPIAPPQVLALFDFRKSDIKPEYFNNIKDYANILKANSSYKAIIMGHSDMKGSDRTCNEISEKRAIAVKNILMNYGIPSKRLYTIAMGKSDPVWKFESNEMQAAENRRVEIVLVR